MKVFALLIPIVLCSSTSFAQDDPIRVETNLVTVNVSVTRKGKDVAGLGRSDFTVWDNGKKQDIDIFSAGDAPVSFGIVYDMHPTTDATSANVLGALRKFVEGLGNSDDYFVSVFNEKGTLTSDFVPTEEQVRREISGGANSLYDAIFAASDRIVNARNHKRVLLVLTDGADHNSHHSFKQLKLRLRSLNLPVYALTFGTSERRQYAYSDIFRDRMTRELTFNDTNALEKAALGEISKTTGGQRFDANARNRIYLAALCSKVREDIRSQYVLGFSPDTNDGKWHSLKVTITDQRKRNLKISNRKGYQSPRSRP